MLFEMASYNPDELVMELSLMWVNKTINGFVDRYHKL